MYNLKNAFDPMHPAFKKTTVNEEKVPSPVPFEEQFTSFTERADAQLFHEVKQKALVERVADLQARVDRSETHVTLTPYPEQDMFDIEVKLNGKTHHVQVPYDSVKESIRTDSNPVKYLVDELYTPVSRLHEEALRGCLTALVSHMVEYFTKQG